MKKLLSLLFTVLLLPQVACRAQENKLVIIATNFPAFDFAREIAGDKADVSMLLPPGAEAHSYEPSPRDIVAVSEADLLIYNGGHGDFWVDGILASFGDKAPDSLAMMDCVDTVSEEVVEGMEEEPEIHHHEENEAHEEEEEDLDEHVWTSPLNVAGIAEAIAGRLTQLDPENTGYYQNRLDDYTGQLRNLDLDFREMIKNAKRKTIVLGDRFPMRYFTREYGLDYYAAFPGCSAQTEPSARTLAFLMDKIREENIPVVFFIEFSSRRSSSIIASETGAVPLLLHSAHNVSQADLDRGMTYLTIMRENLNNLEEALN